MKLFDWFSRKKKPEERAMTSESFGGAFPLQSAAYGVERECLGIPSALCAINRIATAFSNCPVEIIETTKSGAKNIVQNHPLSYKLNFEVNDEVSAVDWKQTAIHHVLLWGNTMSEIVTNKAGELQELKLLLPNYTRIMRNDVSELVYWATLYPDMRTVYLNQADVLHVKGISFDGLIGLPPITMCRLCFDLAHDQESYASHWFKNNSKPMGFYKFPSKLSQSARDNIIKSHQLNFAGACNSNKTGILEEGGSFEVLTLPADDGQWLSSRNFQLSEIARIFNIDPRFLFDGRQEPDLETLYTQFVQCTLMPWIVKFELELKRKILGRTSNLSAHFNVRGLLRGDVKSRFSVYSTALQNGIYNINEVRAFEGLPDIGPQGDAYRVQLNMSDSQASSAEPDEQAKNMDQVVGEETFNDEQI